MKTFIKRIAICMAIAFIVSAFSAHAQQGSMAAGLNYTLAFNSDGALPAGINPKFQYYITDCFRGEADATFFLPDKSETAYLDMAVYAHYLFRLTEQAAIFPVAGIGLLSASATDRSSLQSWPNAAVGGGIEYDLSSKISISAELKYKFVSSGMPNFGWMSVGVAYKFK